MIKIKDVEEFLRQYKQMKVQVKIYENEISTYDITGVSSLNFDHVGITGQGNITSPTEQEALKRKEVIEKLAQKITILKSRICLIDLAIKALSDIEQKVVIRKIINQEPYYRMCGDLHISERYAKKIKKEAIEKIRKTIS